MVRQRAVIGFHSGYGSREAHRGDWNECLNLMSVVRCGRCAGDWAEGKPLELQASGLPR
jgi:hypothetical protein